jgi:hypothetical protein
LNEAWQRGEILLKKGGVRKPDIFKTDQTIGWATEHGIQERISWYCKGCKDGLIVPMVTTTQQASKHDFNFIFLLNSRKTNSPFQKKWNN